MVAVIYILTIMMTVSGLLYRLYKDPIILNWAGVWAGITFIAFFIGNTPILLLSLMLFGFYFAPKQPVHRIAYFFALYPVVPDAITWLVPGPPGVNFLFYGTPPMFAELGLFVPLLILLIEGKGPDRRKLLMTVSKTPVERWVWYYFLLSCVLSVVRMASPAMALRELFVHFLWMFPFFVISRCIRNMDDFKFVLKAILYGACVVACLGIFERLRHWNPFFNLPRSLTIEPGYLVPLYRGGLLRVQSSLTQAIVFGYYMSMAVGVAWICYANGHRSKIYLLGTVGVTALASFFAVSKGPWLAGIVMIAGLMIFKIKKPKFRNLVVAVLLTGGVVGYMELTSIDKGETAASGGAVASDYDASVNYRKRLAEAGWITMQENLLFGSPDALSHPAMQSMRQGQGIIDLVNVYVTIGLFKGLVGAALFVMIILSSIYTVYNLIKDEVTPESEPIRDLGALFISSILGSAIMIYSMSELGIVHDYLWALFAFCAAFNQAFAKEKITLPNGKSIFVLRERYPRRTRTVAPVLPVKSFPYAGAKS